MIRSMFSAISGLRNHQTMMDVVGNNISNVNTTGFKSSSVVFQDVLSQMVRGGGAAQDELGGTNPAQVGLGSRIAAITTNFGQGALQRTGRATDLAVQGDGFFVVQQAGQELFTRAGSFSVDALGRLVTQEGGFIMGWGSTAAGEINTDGLDLADGAMDTLLHIDADGWKQEMADVAEYLDTYGDHCPDRLKTEHKRVADALDGARQKSPAVAS